MHLIEAQIRSYLERSNTENVGMSDFLIEEATRNFRKALSRRFNSPPRSSEFRLSLSKVGKPTCQLQMEKAGAQAEPLSYNFPLQMLMGDIFEIVLMAVMKASGVAIEAEQQTCHLEFDGEEIFGRDDVEIEGKVWDVKSSASWTFNNKWARGYEEVAKTDAFGYVTQGFAYGEGRKKPFGGWIVGDKESGRIAVVPVPTIADEHRIAALDGIRTTMRMLREDAPFERCFEDVPETHYKKPTGNRYLGTTCSFCAYKYACWPGLQHLPKPGSDAKNPTWRYYTHIEEAKNDENSENIAPNDKSKTKARKVRKNRSDKRADAGTPVGGGGGGELPGADGSGHAADSGTVANG